MTARILPLSALLLASAACTPDISVIEAPQAEPCDAIVVYADVDGDGFGDASTVDAACELSPGWVLDARDCDDAHAGVHPDAPEVCNGIDDNCDAVVDNDAVDRQTGYLDADDDGYGDPAWPIVACELGDGVSINDLDCDDSEASAHPGLPELCDGLDNDCDGHIDVDAADAPWWFADDDLDGHGDPASAVAACEPPAGHLTDDSDCDDSEAAMHPGHVELCDGLDNDCDGVVPVDEVDADGDGIYDCAAPPVCAGSGLTFGVDTVDPALGTTRVACEGCDPYGGETPCTEQLPVLCILDQGLPNPGFTTDYYNGWSGGTIDATAPVSGCALTSLEAADDRCAAELGVGWRMAEFHDGGGGWGWYAYGVVPDDERLWTHIDDQPANCWQ